MATESREIMPCYRPTPKFLAMAKEFIYYIIESPYELTWYRDYKPEGYPYPKPHKVFAVCNTRRRVLWLDPGSHEVCSTRYLNPVKDFKAVPETLDNLVRDWGDNPYSWIEREIIKTVRQMKLNELQPPHP